MAFRELWSRVRAALAAGRLDSELDEEIGFHVDMEAERLERLGMDAGEARRTARLRFGGPEAVRAQHRDARGLPWWDELRQDARVGVRSLGRDPRFTLLAVLTLTLGIAATTTIFSLLRGVVLDPLPYREPGRLVRVYESNARFPLFPIGPQGLLTYRHDNRTLADIAGYTREDLQFAGAGRPVRLRGLQVSCTYFRVLGIGPAIGRAFTWAEEREHADVAILSHEVWRERFNGDPEVVGRGVRFSGRLFTIVGVMPAGFEHVGGRYRSMPQGETVDVWWPLPLDRASERTGWHYINAIARLKPDVTPARAASDLGALSARVHVAADPWSIRVVPLLDDVVGASDEGIRLLTIAVGLVMLIACANVSSLLLARGTSRIREHAIRYALGASRWRLVRQSLTESLVLSAPAFVGGGLLTIAGVRLLLAVLPPDFPRLHNIRVDWAVLAFAAAVTGVAVIVFGTLPAWQQGSEQTHPQVAEGAARAGTGRRTMRLRGLLVVSEMALASALLVGAGLLARSFVRLQHTPPGFDSHAVVTARLSLPETRYPRPEQSARFFESLVGALQHAPGVRRAGAGSDVPWTGYDENTGFDIVGETRAVEPDARFHTATPGYFEALRIPLLEGRVFDGRDRADTQPVVVVNQALVRKYLAGRPAVGRQLRVWDTDRVIVGIVGDVKDAPADADTSPALWWPHPQMPFPGMTLVVRTASDPMAVVPDVRHALASLDPELPLAEVRTLDEIAAAANAQRRFLLVMTGLFAAAALLLASIGAYGVLAWTVQQRTRELGIRVALGARRRQVLSLVLGQGLGLAAIGLVVGLALALASGRILQALLFSVSPRDEVSYAAAGGLMLAMSAAASLVPALAATRTNPVEALRCE